MQETSASLLDRLRQQPDESSWQQLVGLYGPLIRAWLGRYFLKPHDSQDVLQEIFTVVVRKLPEFERAPRVGAFRRWLRTITVRCLRDYWRARKNMPLGTGDTSFKEMLDQLEDDGSALSRQWDVEHDQHVARELLERLKPRFEPQTWAAFQLVAVQGIAPREAAEQLGVSTNVVFIAKSRIMAALREEAQGLLD